MNISQLNQATTISSGDQIPIYSTNNSDTQKCSLSLLSEFIIDQIGGENGLVTQYSSPNASGFIVSLGFVPNTWLLLTPTAGFAAGTLILPPYPTDQNQINVNTTQIVTALAINGNGNAVIGAPTTLAANDRFTLRFDTISATWYRVS